jgi:hypothetical protein
MNRGGAEAYSFAYYASAMAPFPINLSPCHVHEWFLLDAACCSC